MHLRIPLTQNKKKNLVFGENFLPCFARGKRGFTLVEIIVVVGIIIIILAITLVSYRVGNQQLTLKRAGHKLAQDVRRAQEMAISTREFEGSIPPGGYGLIFKNFTDNGIDFEHLYIIAADDGDNNLVVSEETERINLEKGVKIAKLYSISGANKTEIDTLFFNFIPPDPRTCILGCGAEGAEIVLSLEQDSSATISVEINQAGLIEIIQ